MARVLVSAPLPGDALNALRAAHEVDVGEDPRGLGKAGIVARASGAEALLTLVTDRIDGEVLDAAPSLRVVANFGVGTDNLDLEALRSRGVVATNTPDVLTDATADATFALLLAACRRVAEGDRAVRAGKFTGWAPTDWIGVPVTSATLGIVGLGRIGRAVARRAAGFSMRVVYSQRRRAAAEVERALGATFASLDDLLAASDVVVLCCSLNDDSRGLISKERLAKMKRGGVLVNTARGPIVDEAALAAALSAGHLAAAGLDVYAREPLVEPALLACENAVLTPHLGSADAPARAAMARIAVESVLAVLEGRAPPSRVA